MPADMLSRLRESKLRAIEQLVEDYAISVAGGGVDDQVAAIADFLVDEGIGLKQWLLAWWNYNWTAALAGKIKDRQQTGAQLRSDLERGAAALARAAVLARRGADLSGHEVARLAQFEQQSKEFPLWVEERMARWELLDRPHKPLDGERIARAQAAFERGECESASEILARLQKGGPLVQE